MIRDSARATNERTEVHLRLPGEANDEFDDGIDDEAKFAYVNYAKGGAMGASDQARTGTGARRMVTKGAPGPFLGTFADQCMRYRRELVGAPSRETLHIVWFGLNDLVTNKRDPGDMRRVAEEMRRLCNGLHAASAHFIIANMPNPREAVAYLGQDTAKVRGLLHGALEFHHHLVDAFNGAPRTHIFDLHTVFQHVSDNLAAYNLRAAAQPKGVKVNWDPGAANVNGGGPYCTTTSDRVHPTETVYKLIAQFFALAIRENEWTLGDLTNAPESYFSLLDRL